MAFNLGAAIQDVLTRGLDVAQTVVNNRFQVNDPAGQVTGPAGSTARVGQPVNGVSAALGGVPTWVWIAGAAAIGLALVLRK
jgi:hypothetical protein